MRLLPVSATSTRPSPSTATALGACSSALVATAPSPENPGVPVPAILVMLPSVSTRITRWFSVSAMNTRPWPSIARPCGSASAACVAAFSVPTAVVAVHTVRTHMSQPSLALRLPSSQRLALIELAVAAHLELPAVAAAAVARDLVAVVAGLADVDVAVAAQAGVADAALARAAAAVRRTAGIAVCVAFAGLDVGRRGAGVLHAHAAGRAVQVAARHER